MKKRDVLRIGVKREKAAGPVTRGSEPGPLPGKEIEGQGLWLVMQCPWCGGVNRVEETVEEPGVIVCAWCGNMFS
jgi:hypothetical protein